MVVRARTKVLYGCQIFCFLTNSFFTSMQVGSNVALRYPLRKIDCYCCKIYTRMGDVKDRDHRTNTTFQIKSSNFVFYAIFPPEIIFFYIIKKASFGHYSFPQPH